ncbi:MAG: hypothetical protein Q9208_006633 [Pyrenodesmia sp. 3 TL-2023]
MATPTTARVAGALSSRSTIVTNLFDISTGACSLALSIAGLQTDRANAPQETATVVLTAQAVSNPDIAGIGILIAFLATAYGIFIWMLAAYLCRLLPAPLLGQVDIFVFKRPARRRTCPPWWQNAVDQTLLAYADVQIVTGVGILVAACSTVRSLSVYHLQVAIYLAWMSSNTHLTAISLLQTDFRENRNGSLARRLRLGGMVFLGVFLLIALVPTTAYNWLAIITQSKGTGRVLTRPHKPELSPAGVPARCFWQPLYSGGRTADAAWSFIILVTSYVWKGLLLFQRSQKFVKASCRHWVLQPLQRSLDHLVTLVRQHRRRENYRWIVLRYKTILCVYVAAWAIFELAQSFVMSLWICGGGLVWGSFQILVPRQRLPAQTLEAEDSWIFGQVLPIMLLALPILSFARGYTTQKAENDQNSHLKGPQPSPSTLENQDGRRDTNPTSSFVQAVTEHDAESANAPNTTPMSVRTTCNTLDIAEENSSRGTTHLPPWRDDSQIYASRFIIAAFWGSQLGILALVTFIVFFPALFIPLGISGQSKIEGTLRTESWIWSIVGCSIAAWIGVAIALLTGGAIFSSLFAVNYDEIIDEDERS